MIATPRAERLAPWIAGGLLALPILLARYPPMLDLPPHEAVVGLLRHWGDAAFVPPNVYALNLGQANQAFYFAILALSYPLSISVATKLVVASAVFLLPVAAGHLAAHLGVTRWTALLVAPLGLGWMFFYGLIANLLGLATYLFALPTLDRFVRAPSGRGLARVAAWILALHFVHDFMALTAGLTLVVFTLCLWTRGAWRNVARIAPVSLTVLAALLSRAHQAGLVGSGQGQIVEFAPLGYRLETFPDALFAGTGFVSSALLVVASLPLALFLLERVRTRTDEAADGTRPWRYRFEILGGVFLALYFIAPIAIEWPRSAWAGVTQLSMRFLPLTWSVLCVTAAPREASGGSSRLAKTLACIVPLAPLLVAGPELWASDRLYRALDRASAYIAPGSAHVLLELDASEPGTLLNPASAGGHVVASRGGRSLFDYTRSPAAPVVERAEAQWREPYERIDGHPFRLIPEHDLARFRYVLLHSANPGVLEITARVLAPEARVVFHEPELTLLESTRLTVPIDAPDDPYPLPHPPDLGDRIQAFAKQVGAAP